MVDSTQHKMAAPNAIDDDDPFAELTRIMGFDPRQPVKPAASQAVTPLQPASRPVEEAQASEPEDDFGIDLERELLGAFEDDQPQEEGRAFAQPEPEAAAFEEVEPDLDLDGALDDEIHAAVGAEMDELRPAMSQPVETLRDEPEAPAAELRSEAQEDPFGHDFDSAMSAVDMDFSPVEAEAPLAFEPETDELDWQEPELEPQVAAAEDRFAVDLDDLRLDDAGANEDDAYVGAAEPAWLGAAQDEEPAEPLFDEAELSAALARDEASADDRVGEPELGLGPQDFDFDDQPAAEAAAPVVEAAAEPLFDEAEFGAALAREADDASDHAPEPELGLGPQDFDFAFDEQPAVEAVSPVVEAPAEPLFDDADFGAALAEDEAYDEIRADDRAGEPELSLEPQDFDFAFDDQPVEEVASPVAEEPVAAASSSVSLEDELNALLGNIAAQQANTPIPSMEQPRQAASEAVPAYHSAHDPQPVLDDLKWDLDDEDFFEATEGARLVANDDARAPAPSFEAALRGSIAAPAVAAAARPRRTEDPLAEIERMTARYSRGDAAPAEPEEDFQFDLSDEALDGVPMVETVDVADDPVAVADDLDLPDFDFEENVPPAVAADDLDAEFAGLLNEMNAAEPSPMRGAARQIVLPQDEPAYDVADDYAYDVAGAAYGGRPAAGHYAYDDDRSGGYAAANDGYDPALDDDLALPAMADEQERPQRRGFLVAAIVGGVALLGGVGAFALSFGGGAGSDTPVLVKADEGPVKVKPQNPGGTTVPNQDNKVYDTVAGRGTVEQPRQEKLVTTAEEPIDVTPPESESALADAEEFDLGDETVPASGAPTAKGEDRIEQILSDAEADPDLAVAAVQPRRVRTMIVKPDGTLVPREEPAPQPAAEAAPEAPAAPAQEETTRTAAADPVAEAAPAVPPAASAETTGATAMPESVPLAPQRPSEQPVDVVGEVKPEQVAALPAAATSGGGWSMQIASQPSEAAAQASYQDLARRYGSVLSGRQANIVKAEIAGKGTFWRVRVPAGSRNEAISLCESYKAAGGNCFVSR